MLQRVHHYERDRIIEAVLGLTCVLICGSIGFMIVEGWSFWRSFYFTLLTVTTVGYGDEGMSERGEMFATVVLLGGIAVASYSFAVLMQFVVSKDFGRERRMKQRISQMNQHTIVCGYGRMGKTICDELSSSGVDVVVIDKDADVAADAEADGYVSITGCASEDEVLERAAVARAATLVAASSNMAEAVVTAMTARDLAPEIRVIARAEREEDERKLRRAGAGLIVSPFTSGGYDIAAAIIRPSLAEFITNARTTLGSVTMAELTIAEASELEGRTLADYGSKEATAVSFVALRRDGAPLQIPPPGVTELASGDVLIVAGDPDAVLQMKRHAA